jgi:hypothetical protein
MASCVNDDLLANIMVGCWVVGCSGMSVDGAEGICYTTATSIEENSILERTSLAKLMARLSAGK